MSSSPSLLIPSKVIVPLISMADTPVRFKSTPQKSGSVEVTISSGHVITGAVLSNTMTVWVTSAAGFPAASKTLYVITYSPMVLGSTISPPISISSVKSPSVSSVALAPKLK